MGSRFRGSDEGATLTLSKGEKGHRRSVGNAVAVTKDPPPFPAGGCKEEGGTRGLLFGKRVATLYFDR
jgi:hypothetical protein